MDPIEPKMKDIAKEMEAVLMKYTGGEKPGMAIAITLPPDYQEVHWITNLTRRDGLNLLRSTTAKMQQQMN